MRIETTKKSVLNIEWNSPITQTISADTILEIQPIKCITENDLILDIQTIQTSSSPMVAFDVTSSLASVTIDPHTLLVTVDPTDSVVSAELIFEISIQWNGHTFTSESYTIHIYNCLNSQLPDTS